MDLFLAKEITDGCTSIIPSAGGTLSTCFCRTDLCNGSSISSVNYSIIGILALFHFLN